MTPNKSQITCFLTVALTIFFWCVSIAQASDDRLNTSYRFALNFNEAMNRCLQTGCKNIEKVIGFFDDECSYLDDYGHLWTGKATIRKQLLSIQVAAGTSDHIEGLDVAGSVVTMRLERRRVFKTGKFDAAEVKPHVQVVLLKSGRITRLISVISQDEK